MWIIHSFCVVDCHSSETGQINASNYYFFLTIEIFTPYFVAVLVLSVTTLLIRSFKSPLETIDNWEL